MAVLIGRAEVAGQKTLVPNDSGGSEKSAIEIRMAADSAIDQCHSNAGACVTGLPRCECVDRRRSIAQVRLQGAVEADVDDIGLVRQAHDAVAIEQRDYAIDDRHITQDRTAQFQNVVYQTIDEAEQPAAIDLCSGRILNNNL